MESWFEEVVKKQWLFQSPCEDSDVERMEMEMSFPVSEFQSPCEDSDVERN